MRTFRAARWQFVEQKFMAFGPIRFSEYDAMTDVWADRDESGKDIGRYTVLTISSATGPNPSRCANHWVRS